MKQIKTALISVFNKDGLNEIVKLLHKRGVKIISTGGTAKFIRGLNIPVTEVEDITKFPSVFGGRVKTLQPQIFGGILNRRNNAEDKTEKIKYKINDIDLVIVDLYPFEETRASNGGEEEIIEKIKIGGVAPTRAAAKNFEGVVVIPSKDQYKTLLKILKNGRETEKEERKNLAGIAFEITSSYDSAIRSYFQGTPLRYGENPHQDAMFVGDLSRSFIQISGKELSYNNLIDTEAAISVVNDFKKPAFAIVKHMNTCGLSVRPEGKIFEAYKSAYKADPLSAFGGILAANREIGEDIAKLIKKQNLFVEVIIAPSFSKKALETLQEKKNCRILKCLPAEGSAQAGNRPNLPKKQIRTCFTGMLVQDRDNKIENEKDLKIVTERKPIKKEVEDMLVASVATKHLKSNAIALVKNGTLISMGCGQTSRIDALKQAIDKAKNFGFSLKGASMSSEAFFPFPDCIELAGKVGIKAIIQPGGSKNDQASIKMADKYKMAMAMTGFRHFKH